VLTGTTYTKGEIAAIVRRSCLAFVPTERDRQDLQALGATGAIFRAIDACVRNGRSSATGETAGRETLERDTAEPETPTRKASARVTSTRRRAPAPLRPLELTRVSSNVSAVAGTVAYITVELRRGKEPERGRRLVLEGAAQISGGPGEKPSAVTDARGRATFAVPAGTRVRTYRLVIAAADGATLRGGNSVVLMTLPAAPTSAALTPSVLAIDPGIRGTREVTAIVADAFGNPVPRYMVQLRPPVGRPGLSVVSRETSDSGTARFAIPTAALRDADTFTLLAGGRTVATLRVTTAPAVAAAASAVTMAAARTSGLMLEAARLAASGRHAAAEAVYDSVLAVDSNIVAARLGRAYVRSWERKDDAARSDFLAVLRADSLNVSALTGLGYNYAWAGNYAEAEARFREALRIAPDNEDADKGLAYVALWRGDAREAARRFQGVTERHSRDAEAQVGLGQSYLRLEEPDRARAAFERALAIDPQRRDAREALRVARASTRPLIELTAWGGYTAFSNEPSLPAISGNGNSELGIRFAEIAYWPARNVRVWAQYENGLTLDNIAYVRAGETAPAYYVGGFVSYRGRYTTRLETGIRDLPGDVRQSLVRAEQVVTFPSAAAIKFGGWLGPRSDHTTEWLAHAAVSWPVTQRFRIEPTFFYSRSGAPGASEQRLLLFGEYAFANGWKLGSGIAGGRADPGSAPRLLPIDPLTRDQDTQNLWDAFVITEVPVGTHRGHFLLRHQQIIHGTGLTVVALGFTLGL
jgi:tetratricopeptide (TPR) repeat protein